MAKLNTIMAILAICAIELVALKQGIDGVLLAGAVAAIAGLGGFTTGRLTAPTKTEKKSKK